MSSPNDLPNPSTPKPNRRRVSKIRIGIVVCIIVIAAIILWWMLPGGLSPGLNGDLAPGAADAITAALGSNGLKRVTQIIPLGNKPTLASGGTHGESGVIDGRPYGLAFDILILPGEDADADTRGLRLQGIAAWHRGPDAPGGPAGLGPHIHCVWAGARTENRQNTEQISSFVHGYRGLANADRPMNDWRDVSIQDDEIASVKTKYEALYGVGSLTKARTYDALHHGRRGGG